MVQSPVAKKLQIKPGNKVLVLNAPDSFGQELGSLLEGVSLSATLDGEFDVVISFYTQKTEAEADVNALRKSMGQAGILWVAYPKGTSKVATDLNRDILRVSFEEKGLKAVSLVSIDSTWSAMRFKQV